MREMQAKTNQDRQRGKGKVGERGKNDGGIAYAKL